MDEIKAKQQVVEKIKESSKILVTVSDSPSVDALSAALALTLLLDKQEKYSTAIFSGETPPAIAFLEPEKTFDDTTDSLRDFIIALNKEKADHLRYKVEGESVKIFITPYKTTIDQNDLEFSQGDYNVELVIALGVDNQDHLDKALEDHGKILHDAAIVTLTAGEQSSDLGGVDWHDANASSLSEMIAGLAEALKEDKKRSLLDQPIATALLTGIVAQTDRFSNEHTTAKAMTVAAALMAAGADQQLIATELQASVQPAEEAPQGQDAPDDKNETPDEPQAPSDEEGESVSDDGALTIPKNDDPSSLAIAHDDETLADLDRRVLGDEKAKEKVTEEVEALQEAAASEDLEPQDTHSAYQPEAEAPISDPIAPVSPAYGAEDDTIEPILGGTLNATTEQAADDARREAENDQNRTILSHSYLGSTETEETPTQGSPLTDTPSGFPGTPPAAPGSAGVNDVDANDGVHAAYAAEDEPTAPAQSAAPFGGSLGGARVIQPLGDAPSGLDYEPIAPQLTPEQTPTPPADFGLPLPPPLPDFSQVNGAAPAFPLPPTPQPAILEDILAPEPPAPIDMTANAVPDPGTAYAPEPPLPPQPEQLPPAPEQPPQPPTQNDPTQFQIPPQP